MEGVLPPLPHCHWTLTRPREAALIVHTPAQGTRPPGRGCGTAEGQACLAVNQEAAQAQAASSWTLQRGIKDKAHCPPELKESGMGCGYKGLRVKVASKL